LKAGPRGTARAAALSLLFLCCSVRADRVSTVTVEAFPPETEIHAFVPGSPPQEGDIVGNGSPFQVRGTISFPLRLSAPGYNSKEVNVALIKDKAVAAGEWRFHYELEPDGVVSMVRHEFRRYPGRSYGALALLLAGASGAAWMLSRRVRAEALAAKRARQQAEQDAAATRQRLDEVDPELIGRTIDAYEVLAMVGEGAFAKVYKVRHTEYKDIFALKVLRPELLDQRVGERVEREMAIGRDLVHPYLVRAFGFGTFRDAPYLVLEFVEGQPLDEKLAEGSLSMKETLAIVQKVAEGVQYAHGRGVIHRDLKPANLFLTPGGGVKILDFGVAKILDSERRLTLTGQALGTPHYMAPEQARGHAGVGSDVYALGAILFEMLTGGPPFDGDTALEVMTSHTFSEIPSARALNPRVPESLDSLLAKMLAKSPQDRPQSMAEVIRALQGVSV
jgi:serine/threonine-protein kinase